MPNRDGSGPRGQDSFRGKRRGSGEGTSKQPTPAERQTFIQNLGVRVSNFLGLGQDSRQGQSRGGGGKSRKGRGGNR